MVSMSTTSIVFGLLLNAIGLSGYFGTGAAHPTALIPCGLGILLIVSGLLARNPKLHMHAMHVAVLIALLGFGATVSATSKIPLLLNHSADTQGAAYLAKIATALVCGIFVILCMRSFVMARLLRKGKSGS